MLLDPQWISAVEKSAVYLLRRVPYVRRTHTQAAEITRDFAPITTEHVLRALQALRSLSASAQTRPAQSRWTTVERRKVDGKRAGMGIEKEMRNKKGLPKDREPKTSIITKNCNHLIKEDIESLLKQGGNHIIQFLLAQAEKSPKEMQHRDIVVIK